MLFQPTNIIPDERTGIGFGTVDVSSDWYIAWQVNGDYPVMTAYSIQFYQNNAASTPVYNTGKLTTNCPFYGRDAEGNIQFFTHQMSAGNGITNGNEYKFVITQYYMDGGTETSIVQSSASVFRTRKAPTFTLTTATVGSAQFTFSVNYSQLQGDTLEWIRWQLQMTSGSETEQIYDSGNIFGTPVYEFTYTGFFRGSDYAIRVTGQTSSGVQMDTEWIAFRPAYNNPTFTATFTAACQPGLNAVKLDWTGATTISGQNMWSIWRQRTGDVAPQFVGKTDVGTTTTLYDFAAPGGGEEYTYILWAGIAQTSSTLESWSGNRVSSNTVTPNYYKWTLYDVTQDDNGSYRIQAVYDFKYNLDSGSVGNNNTPGVLNNFTAKPTVQPAPQNYRSGSLSALVGATSDTGEYSDTADAVKALMALSAGNNTLFLKPSKGDVLEVRLNGNVTVSIAETTKPLAQTVTVPWVEINDEPQSIIALPGDAILG